MSDSLLNLLEVLNEVLEEQKLQEQASGGAPTLEDIYKPFVQYYKDYYEKALPRLKKEIETIKAEKVADVQARKAAGEQIKKPSSLYASETRYIKRYTQALDSYNENKGTRTSSEKFIIATGLIFNNLATHNTTPSPYNPPLLKNEKRLLDNLGAKIPIYILNLNTSLLQQQQGDPQEITHSPLDQENLIFLDQAFKLLTSIGRISPLIKDMRMQSLNLMRQKFSIRSSDSVREIFYEPLFNNLKNGIGTYDVHSYTSGARNKQSKAHVKYGYLADQKQTLDYLDLKNMKNLLDFLSEKEGNFDKGITQYRQGFGKYIRFLKSTDQNRVQPAYKPLFMSLVKSTFNSIFREAYENRDKYNKWKKILPYMIAPSDSDEAGLSMTLDSIEQFKEFTSDWRHKFLSKYRDFYSSYAGGSLKTDSDYETMIDDIKPNLGKTFTNPKINLSDGSLSNDFLFVVDNFFDSSANDFDSRKDQFVEKMDIFFKDPRQFNKELSNIELLDFMNRVLLMDYFVEFSKGFTNITAGVLFEYFLAGLFNGEVVGHLQGVTDFKVGEELYSAKFLAPGSPVRQALSRFQEKDVHDKTITYILGKKLKSYKAKKTGTFGVEEIHDVELYEFQIKYKNGIFYVNGGDTDAETLGLISIDKNQDVNMDKIIAQEKPFAKIRIMSTDKDTIKAYREALKDKLKGSTDKLIKQKKNILEMVQDIFDSIKEGESSARKYVSDGKKENGVNAMKKLTKSQISMRLLNKASKEYEDLSKPNDT